MRMSELIETVSKKPIPPHQTAVIVEVMAEDSEGEDVEVSATFSFFFLCHHQTDEILGGFGRLRMSWSILPRRVVKCEATRARL